MADWWAFATIAGGAPLSCPVLHLPESQPFAHVAERGLLVACQMVAPSIRPADDARQHARAGRMQRPLADWTARMGDLLLSDRHRPPALLVGSIPEEPFVLT